MKMRSSSFKVAMISILLFTYRKYLIIIAKTYKTYKYIFIYYPSMPKKKKQFRIFDIL